MLFSVSENTITSVSVFDPPLCLYKMITRVKSLIHILCFSTNLDIDDEQPRPHMYLRAHDDTPPHDLLIVTSIEEIKSPLHMVGIEDTGTVYVFDMSCGCIWAIDTDNNDVKKWLSVLGDVISLSVTRNNRVLVLIRFHFDSFHLEIYNQEAKLERNVSLPDYISYAFSAVQKPNGELVFSHRLRAKFGMFVSSLGFDGHVTNESQLEGGFVWYQVRLFLYSVDNYLVAAEQFSGKIFLLDMKTSKWSRLLENLVCNDYFYCDGNKPQFIVATNSGVEMLTLNITPDGNTENESQETLLQFCPAD